jgi:hypothetical protein
MIDKRFVPARGTVHTLHKVALGHGIKARPRQDTGPLGLTGCWWTP